MLRQECRRRSSEVNNRNAVVRRRGNARCADTMSATITGVVPMAACERGRIMVYGGGFSIPEPFGPQVRLGQHAVRVVAARVSRLKVLIPPGLPGGTHRLHVDGVDGNQPYIEIGTVVAAGLHQVDNPVVDAEGRLYVTYSGRVASKCRSRYFASVRMERVSHW